MSETSLAEASRRMLLYAALYADALADQEKALQAMATGGPQRRLPCALEEAMLRRFSANEVTALGLTAASIRRRLTPKVAPDDQKQDQGPTDRL